MTTPPPVRDLGIVTVTGHRPQHLDGDFGTSTPLWGWIAAHLDRYLIRAERLRCGMALGVDLLAAERAHLLGVPYDAYIPFEGQVDRWPTPSKARHARAIIHASRRFLVNEGEYAAWKLHARNAAMLDPPPRALIAVWNGKESGGTYRMVQKADALGVEVLRIDPTPWLS
jgi:uncharacterized phage-like protein YoqJ